MPTSECFVYVQLPGVVETVTCGRFVQADGVGRFVYGRSYLSHPRAVELEKFELPLRTGTFETARLGGIFGSLRDASPDAWGRRIIERALGSTQLTEVDYLLHSPDDRAGALSFGTQGTPPPAVHRFNQVVQLQELLRIADRIERDLPVSAQLTELVQAGTSLGGARPKNVVEDRRGLWLAKFPSRSDRWNSAAVEGAMLVLAAECGLDAARAQIEKVARRPVLLVRRFDRKRVAGGYLRSRMVSALTVLRADDHPQDRARWSYLLLADELARWATRPAEDLRELFGRMAFNALIHNADDHPRNHALIADREGWRLAPAYDLNPTPTHSRERNLAMVVGAQHRRATRQNLLSQCERFRLSRAQATRLIDRMKRIVTARWREVVRGHGGTTKDLAAIESAFDHTGFEYE
ncbi:MAG: type II toxin-antitoxin system HipA family toxin [Myxococcota bacterium]|nr:type II toxin-antitoxin system HipA family toxin [Myxococcota bacterium]